MRDWMRRKTIGMLLCGSLLLAVAAPADGFPDLSGELADCAKIGEGANRLKCYDRIAGRSAGKSAPADPSQAVPRTEEQEERGSYFSRLWELEPKTRRNRYALSSHNATYILPYTYNASPNFAAVQKAHPGKDLKREEMVFQLSLKVKLWEDILGEKADLWAGYTQRSFWQFYNFEDSSPFRETNYEPELLLNLRTDYNILGLRGRFLNLGLNHQSNGQSAPLSRSWNRVVANAGFERGDFSFLVKGWYRIPESAKEDDNPRMDEYVGYGEVWGYYFLKGNRFGIMLRNNLAFRDNRGAVQMEWSFPITRHIGGYLQYFYGYGENLLDYDHRVERIGIGFILKNWD
jgi:phospholipase A1